MVKKRIIKAGKGFGDSRQPAREGIELIKQYLDRDQGAKARAKFQELQERYPDNPEVLEIGLLVAESNEDGEKRLEIAEKLVEIVPNKTLNWILLAECYLAESYLFLALETYRQVLEKFPNDSRAEDARESVQKLEEATAEILEELQFEPEDIPIVLLHERSQISMARGELDRAIETIEEILKAVPDFLPAFNNLSLVYRLQEKFTEALATSDRVLEIRPDNFHALSNAVNYAMLLGQFDRAKTYGEKLKDLPNDRNKDIYVKKAEAFSFLREDRAIVELGEKAEKEKSISIPSLFWHWVAVAHANEGNLKKARQLWKKIGHLPIAKENLHNLNLPTGESSSPWAFDVDRWIKRSFVEQINSIFKEKNEKKQEKLIQEFVNKNADMIALAPLLLDRGSPSVKKLVLSLAGWTGDRQLLESLKTFALGDRGADQERFDAVQLVMEKGLIDPGMVRMWCRGEWKELLMMGAEISDEPSFTHPKKVTDLIREGVIALKSGDAEEAEVFLKKALALYPNSPVIQFNLAGAYQLQGRKKEADELMKQVHRDYPEYAFATILLARQAIQDKNLEEAKNLLQTLFSRKHFHFQEYGQFCLAQIELAIAEKNKDVARSWFGMWERIDPEAANESIWADRLKKQSLILE